MPLEIKGHHLRVRQVTPIRGAMYRTDDVGSPHHSQRITMKNPRTGRWVTQSWIFPVEDVRAKRPKTIAMLKKLGVYREAMKVVS